MSLAPGARLGPYEVVAALGAGGMGEVYKGRDTRLDRTVAIKILPPDAAADRERRARFEREAKTVAGLNHPNICTVHDVGSTSSPQAAGGQTVYYLVMEHLAGETLAARLRRGPLPPAQALAVATDIAEALAAAHREGIVHRDLKPGNVMLGKSGTDRQGSPQAKLLDFGLAKLKAPGPVGAAGASSLPTHEPATAAGTLLGTVPYMSPEQLEGKEIDARSDIFSFGAVLYEMLTGRRAFGGESQASIISASMSSQSPALHSSSGSSTVPKRPTCRSGSGDSRPASRAVGSPKRSDTYPCATSCNTTEGMSSGSVNTPNATDDTGNSSRGRAARSRATAPQVRSERTLVRANVARSAQLPLRPGAGRMRSIMASALASNAPDPSRRSFLKAAAALAASAPFPNVLPSSPRAPRSPAAREWPGEMRAV